MADKDKNNSIEPLKPDDSVDVKNTSEQELKVEENKVKFLTPGQMVLKRFFRSKLSVIGLVTLVLLFAFSFLGPFMSAWGESQTDTAQGQDSIMDHETLPYAETVSSYEGLRYLLENITDSTFKISGKFLDDSDVTALTENEKTAKKNLSNLYNHFLGNYGEFVDATGETVHFEVEKSGNSYTVYLLEETEDGMSRINTSIIIRSVSTKNININAYPSWQHWLGTDSDGYDIFTRLMYGGRISLTLGFVVIFIEMLIGVLLGGVAGFFGKWPDIIIMRIVDLLYCLPSMPILLIFSAILDGMEVAEGIRIYLLMGMLAIIGWAGIARVVRGQILFLREQEYMVATEALGLGVPRRIVKHLLPNVMPLLIVQMTLGLGGIILTESTLSYLGLGIRAPKAAWGTMISLADDPVILSRYPNQWIPAGVMIVLAVLAFNFVGDGLRDAFDPKSRR